jgi:hypothetical protein
LKISGNILKYDLYNSNKQILSEDLFNENEMNQVWDKIQCSNSIKFKSILTLYNNGDSNRKSLLSPPLFSFKSTADESKILVDSLGIQVNKPIKVPKYYQKEHIVMPE